MNSVKVRTEDYSYQYRENQVQSPVKHEGSVIEGYFYKENLVKEMAIRKINQSLCGILMVSILCVIVSYYFAMTNELALNVLSRKITTLNDENAELQNRLDRLRSFNNVDSKMTQFNVLQKPEKVIEIQALETQAPAIKNNLKQSPKFFWSVGY